MGLSVYLYECDPSSFNLPVNVKNYVAVTITDQIVVKQALKWALGEFCSPSGSQCGGRPIIQDTLKWNDDYWNPYFSLTRSHLKWPKNLSFAYFSIP